MKKVIKSIISRLSMKEVKTLFWDTVNGMAVNLYIDCYGTEWMAQSKGLFSFRIKKLNKTN